MALTFGDGWIDLPGGAAHSCTIWDASVTGARIGLRGLPDLPERFGLRLNAGGESRPCEIVWRSLFQVGVRFTDSEAEFARQVDRAWQLGSSEL